MRPRGMPSKWVKLRPWYYTERRQPTRAAEMTQAMRCEEDGLMATARPVPREPVKCALPNCRNTFTPAHGAHKYCSDTCKKRGHAYRHVLNPRRG